MTMKFGKIFIEVKMVNKIKLYEIKTILQFNN